jgi:hypothetical protein
MPPLQATAMTTFDIGRLAINEATMIIAAVLPGE